MKEAYGKCPVTLQREDNGRFWGMAVFFWRPLFFWRWVSRGPGIVNCNQAKLSKKELMSPVPCSLGEDPEILMELSNFLHSTVNS